MDNMILYFTPDTCALIPLIALEKIGQPYKLQTVSFKKGQHRSEEFLRLNPKGKVPVLMVEGAVLTENVAILTWLAAIYPEAKLLPVTSNSLERAQQLSDLAFCASGLHPIATRMRIPRIFCDTVDGARRVYDLGVLAMQANFALINRRLLAQTWWYGESWSIVDAYINWIWFIATGAGFDGSAYPQFARHNEEIQRLPAVRRALAANQKATEELDAL